MKKLRLEIDELQVESFSTAADPEQRGTVFGRATHVSPCEPTAYSRCWGLCGEETDGTFCGGGGFTDICDTEYTNCGDRSCNASDCGTCNTSCYHTNCQETCVESICMATQYPYCEA